MKAFLLVISFSFTLLSHAQVQEDSELFQDLKKQDSVFFELSFNLCDIEYLEKHIAADLKFYHDQGGFQGREKFLENTKNNICPESSSKPIRKPISNSFEVYPLYDNGKLYAVIQTGSHNFYIREEGKEDRLTGTARFTHVWTLEENRYILSEVLSYDHKAAPSDN